MHKIYTYAFDLRPPLYIALEQANYFKDGVLKEHFCFNNKYLDVVIHSKNKYLQMKLGILASGDIGKDTLEKIISNYEIYFVLTDSNSISVIELCKNYKIPFSKGIPEMEVHMNLLKIMKLM